jgi:hypothetical protein
MTIQEKFGVIPFIQGKGDQAQVGDGMEWWTGFFF